MRRNFLSLLGIANQSSCEKPTMVNFIKRLSKGWHLHCLIFSTYMPAFASSCLWWKRMIISLMCEVCDRKKPKKANYKSRTLSSPTQHNAFSSISHDIASALLTLCRQLFISKDAALDLTSSQSSSWGGDLCAPQLPSQYLSLRVTTAWLLVPYQAVNSRRLASSRLIFVECMRLVQNFPGLT